jgi:hypothetical protein
MVHLLSATIGADMSCGCVWALQTTEGGAKTRLKRRQHASRKPYGTTLMRSEVMIVALNNLRHDCGAQQPGVMTLEPLLGSL